MNIAKIIYYTREGDKSRTLSLRELCLRDEYDLENVFIAVKMAIDADDLLLRFKRLCCDAVEFECDTKGYVRFIITDIYGRKNYLKFKKGWEP